MLLRALSCAVLVAALLAADAAAQTITRIDVPAALEAQVDRINARSNVPVLLPSRIPSEQAELFPTGGRSRGGYDVELAAAPNCGGATACFFAIFTAQRGGEPAGRTRVRLSNGRRGWFTPLSCGASCSPPQIQWRERGYVYVIQAKVGTQSTERREIIRLANSAIINGPRR